MAFVTIKGYYDGNGSSYVNTWRINSDFVNQYSIQPLEDFTIYLVTLFMEKDILELKVTPSDLYRFLKKFDMDFLNEAEWKEKLLDMVD